MIAGDPHQGGATWAVLQYVLGFRRLGHEVYVVEPVKAASWQPAGGPIGDSVNATYFRDVLARFCLEGSGALVAEGSRQTVGLDHAELLRVTQRADLLINISGMLTDSELIARIPLRIYLDLDPAFVQLWHAAQGVDMRFAGHTHFFTIGQAIGRDDCHIPTCGLPWMTTLQPIVLEHWPVAPPALGGSLTTVGNWRGYGSIESSGVFYGQKAHSLRPLMSLPRSRNEKFLLALAIHPDERNDLAALAENRWQLADPRHVAGSPDAYRRFIQESKAELGIAKAGYVTSRCGWFSDRSICYLASGRPVLAQETGFSRFVPTGADLFAFTNPDEGV